jgi:hypothetical protein
VLKAFRLPDLMLSSTRRRGGGYAVASLVSNTIAVSEDVADNAQPVTNGRDVVQTLNNPWPENPVSWL